VGAAAGKPCSQSCPLRGLEARWSCGEGARSQYENKILRIINSTKGNEGLAQPVRRIAVQPTVTHASPQTAEQSALPGGQFLPPTRAALPQGTRVRRS